MDRELRLISALLSANLPIQKQYRDRAVSEKIFHTHATEVVWINDFYLKHSQYPSKKVFEQRFGVKLYRVKDPVLACLDEVVDFHERTQIRLIVTRTREMFERDSSASEITQYFKTASQALGSESVDTVDVHSAKTRGAFQRYNELLKLKKGVLSGVRVIDTPWPTLNKVIGFMRAGESFTIYSRPGFGKTWLMLAWADYLITRGIDVLFYSKEMPSDQVEDRHQIYRYKINPYRHRMAELTNKELLEWRRSRIKDPQRGKLVIVGEEKIEGTGIDHLVSKIDKYSPQAVFVDGAYLFTINKRFGSEADKMTEISRTMKRVAKAKTVSVVPSIQMGRAGEQDGVVKGGSKTVHGSDSWFQDADFLLELLGDKKDSFRKANLVKGRDTGLGSFLYNFKMDPFVDLTEMSPTDNRAGLKLNLSLVKDGS